ncbi:uncharacterized protein LOC121861931 isoform X2 [Homarus americanus]|uniref:uncharacterized protein LOC121861931 isoform X2 n=1 Tax=Homarus americanus TaxID=6706 RepID=UPI001C4493DC|nr:uncharacterized protein LOC121861931 isoform X2 [Homarus americanus]
MKLAPSPTHLQCHYVVVLVLSCGLNLAHHLPPNEGGLCVKKIDIQESKSKDTDAYKFYLHLEPACSPDERWTVDVVSCEGENDHPLETFRVTKNLGRVCPIVPGCKRLRVNGTYSPPFTTAGEHLDNLSVYFQCFDDENLNLAIVPDPRVKTWNLYVFRCRPEQPRPREGDCPVTSYDKVGNNTYLHIKSRFLPNSVYYFILEPISMDPQCLLQSSIVPFPAEGRVPQLSPQTAPSMAPKLPWWTTNLKVVLLVVAMCITCILGMLAAAFSIRCKITHSVTPPAPHTYKRNEEEEKECDRPSVLLLYSRDSPTHLSRVQHLSSRFTQHLGCQVHDIYVANDINQLADPCEWLLGKLSDGRSSVKVVLLLSPWVTRLLQALVDGKPPPVMESDPEETRFHTNLLTAALRRLLAQDLTRDYHRVFVVSVSEREQVCDRRRGSCWASGGYGEGEQS